VTVPILEPPVRDWYCPACKATDQTKQHGYHVRYHTCPKTRFLSIAMLPAGTAGKIIVHEREAYVGKELVQYDPEQGRPLVSAETIRDNGNDLIVYAPTARADAD
jgi:hypothetical protein